MQGSKLFVARLNDQFTVNYLKDIFSPFGHISDCRIIKNFAFIIYEDCNSASRAVSKMNHALIKGTRLLVEVACGKKVSDKGASSRDFHGNKSINNNGIPALVNMPRGSPNGNGRDFMTSSLTQANGMMQRQQEPPVNHRMFDEDMGSQRCQPSNNNNNITLTAGNINNRRLHERQAYINAMGDNAFATTNHSLGAMSLDGANNGYPSINQSNVPGVYDGPPGKEYTFKVVVPVGGLVSDELCRLMQTHLQQEQIEREQQLGAEKYNPFAEDSNEQIFKKDDFQGRSRCNSRMDERDHLNRSSRARSTSRRREDDYEDDYRTNRRIIDVRDRIGRSSSGMKRMKWE